MIDTEPRARALATKLIKDVRLYAGDRGLTPGAPDVEEARRLFASEVAPSQHGVFDVVLGEFRAAHHASVETSKRGGDILTTVIGIAFLAFLGGIGWVSYRYVLAPGEDANTAALDAWIAAGRGGRLAQPESLFPSTAPALRALEESTGHRVTHTTGAYDLSSGSTCFDIVATGSRGTTAIAVRISGDADAPVVTDVGLRPPCECGRNGRIMRCDE